MFYIGIPCIPPIAGAFKFPEGFSCIFVFFLLQNSDPEIRHFLFDSDHVNGSSCFEFALCLFWGFPNLLPSFEEILCRKLNWFYELCQHNRQIQSDMFSGERDVQNRWDREFVQADHLDDMFDLSLRCHGVGYLLDIELKGGRGGFVSYFNGKVRQRSAGFIAIEYSQSSYSIVILGL